MGRAGLETWVNRAGYGIGFTAALLFASVTPVPAGLQSKTGGEVATRLAVAVIALVGVTVAMAVLVHALRGEVPSEIALVTATIKWPSRDVAHEIQKVKMDVDRLADRTEALAEKVQDLVEDVASLGVPTGRGTMSKPQPRSARTDSNREET